MGIRANTCEDIVDIKKEVDLPVIGIIKSVYDDSDVYITPTMKEIDALAATGVEIIALDATDRPRPNGLDLDTLFKEARAKYPNQLFMADCSCYEDCKHAAEIGFDLVGTTLCGYTAKTKGTAIPNYDRFPASRRSERAGHRGGRCWELRPAAEGVLLPVHAAVIGTAITRPRDITRRFVEAIS